MTINSCQYKVECGKVLCEVGPVQACKMHRAIENQMVAVAVQTALDCGYTSEDIEWLAEFFRVPRGRLERELRWNQENKPRRRKQVRMKAAIYCRVWTGEQDLDKQEIICREYCRRQNIEIYGVYKDEISGMKA